MDRHNSNTNRSSDRYNNDSHPYRRGGPPPSRDDGPRHRGGFSGNRRPFDGNSSPRYGGGVRGGRSYNNINSNSSNNVSEFEVPLSGQKRFGSDYEVPVSGQKRQFPFSGPTGRSGTPPSERYGVGGYEKRNFDGDSFDGRHADGGNEKKNPDGGSFAKLFVGSVPKTATEEDIRPPFEKYGNVVEVALIKDKRAGQQQGNTQFAAAGCCFIKYATSEEADRAIHALHNQYTLPGGLGPIQVRYADGERERLVEYKLFVGSLNKQATEKEVEEIFAPYGRIEDVYLMRDEMKQSRGCGFVKYSNKDAALAAINALNGIYIMRGCEQPLGVRFADPKRPRPGETRGAPAFGGPGFGSQLQSPGIRPPNRGEGMHASVPQNAWNTMNQQGIVPSSDNGMHGYNSQVASRPSDGNFSSAPGGSHGGQGGPSDLYPGPGVPSTSTYQSFNQSLPQLSSGIQNSSPLKKPNPSPQHFPSSMQPQTFSQAPTSSTVRPPGQLQVPNSAGQPSYSQGFPSQPMPGYNGMLPVQQAQAGVPSTTPALSNNLPPQVLTAMMNQYQQPGQQQMLQPVHQSASPLAQMLSQQKQTLQASYQSSQQAFSQLQQQMQLIQPSNPSLMPQQNIQGARLQQSAWPQTSGGPTVKPVTDSLPAASAASGGPVMPSAGGALKCNWTEHTSPDGYKYYYNSITGESKWEKPEELALFEQQQKPQELQQQKAVSIQQPQSQPNNQSMPNQQTQIPQLQLQSHLQTQMQAQGRHPQQLQHPTQPSAYQNAGAAGHQNIQGYGYAQLPVAGGSMNDSARYQQVMPQFGFCLWTLLWDFVI